MSQDLHVKKLNRRDDSLMMEGIRKRLEITPQYEVAGVSTSPPLVAGGGVGSKSVHFLKGPLPTQRRKFRMCCGKPLSTSFLCLLTTSISIVMLIVMIAQLLAQIFTSLAISNELVNSCEDSLQILLSALRNETYASMNTFGQVVMFAARSDMVLDLFEQSLSQVGSTFNFLKASDFDPGENFQALPFMTYQVQASYGKFADITAFGGVNLNGSSVYYDGSNCYNPDTSVLATCLPTIALLDNSDNTLTRCDLFSRQFSCKTYTQFFLADQPPFQNQRQETTGVAKLLWSQPYVIQAFDVMRSNGSQVYFQNSTGVSLSYPVFSSPCNPSSCGILNTDCSYSDCPFLGVLWSTITARAIASFSLRNILVVSNRNYSGFSFFQNVTTFYVANDQGVLMGGAWKHFEEVGVIIPDRVHFANDTIVDDNFVVSTQISKSAQYVQSQFPEGFSNPLFDSFTMLFFHSDTLRTCTTVELNCTAILLLSASPSSSLPSFQAGEDSLRFVLVLTFSLENLEFMFQAQLALADTTKEQQAQAQQLVSQAIGVGAAIAIVAVLCGIVVSFLIALRITKPLSKIKVEMQRLTSFNFEDDDNDEDTSVYYSRVVEVSDAERVMEGLRDSIQVFSKFVPSTVVRNIVQRKLHAAELHVSSREVTVAFSDIKGFTSISEKLLINDLLFLLSRYLTVMTDVVEIYEGTVTEILGDGLLVIWNAPDDCDLHCAKAAACALAMQVAVAKLAIEFNPILAPHGLEDFSIRVGIHSGQVLAGNIGSRTKLKYGCIGDAVNTASRLEGLCKLYHVGIICSRDTFAQFPVGKFQTRELDLVQVKGKDNALGLYEVQALNEMVGLSYSEIPTISSSSSLPSSKRKSLFKKLTILSGLQVTTNKDSPTKPSSIVAKRDLAFGPIHQSNELLTVSQAEINTHYEEALHLFQTGQFAQAKDMLLPAIVQQDAPSRLLLERIEDALTHTIDLSSWTGANRLTEKF